MQSRQLFVVDDSPLPVYAQLAEQVLGALARGELRAGEQLPSVRDVAAELGVNANTVNHAYARLERIGIVETRRGRGTFVAARRRAVGNASRLVELAEPFVARAQALGYAGQQIVNAVAGIVRRTQ
ncbi:MAG TPA: GntR family transcriptional regulator [Candidatus Tumulicola sp.]|jgi:GntR family transcriptional regulator